MTTNHRPLAAFVRSSDGVAERRKEGTYRGDEEQIADVERYVDGLPGKPPVVWLDPEEDVSGGKPIEQRPSLRAAIEGVERGDYGGIVVANLKRLTRSRSGIEIWSRVEAAGGHVHTAAERTDTSTPNGRFIRDIFLADAVREREEHADRHAERRRKTCEAGLWRVRQLPRGYQFEGPPNADGKYRKTARRLVIEPRGAEEVRQAARDVLAGVPIVTIAKRLKMTPGGVRAMLKNRVYLGELWDGGYTRRDEHGKVVLAHERILDITTFDAVGEALKRNPRPARRVEDGPALLAGIIACAGCGHIMTRRATARVVYGCPVHHSGGSCPAPASITAKIIDEYIEQIAIEHFDAMIANGHATNDVGMYEMQVKDVKARITKVALALSNAGLNEEDAGNVLPELRTELSDAEQALREARARSLAPVAKPGGRAWKELSPAGRNAALRGLLDRVVVTRSGRGGRPDVASRVQVIPRGE
jgi:DNA invertase Pin-like site-specific DNA recombinase